MNNPINETIMLDDYVGPEYRFPVPQVPSFEPLSSGFANPSPMFILVYRFEYKKLHVGFFYKLVGALEIGPPNTSLHGMESHIAILVDWVENLTNRILDMQERGVQSEDVDYAKDCLDKLLSMLTTLRP
jgi:hypothetical protein